jgi:hypothetical protein
VSVLWFIFDLQRLSGDPGGDIQANDILGFSKIVTILELAKPQAIPD